MLLSICHVDVMLMLSSVMIGNVSLALFLCVTTNVACIVTLPVTLPLLVVNNISGVCLLYYEGDVVMSCLFLSCHVMACHVMRLVYGCGVMSCICVICHIM